MHRQGIQCSINVQLDGHTIAPLEPMTLRETLHGTDLRVVMHAEVGMIPRVADPVVVTLTPAKCDVGRATAIRLWCSEVTQRYGDVAETFEIVAVDPVSFLRRGTAFRSFAGSMSLHDLVQQVVATLPTGLVDLPAVSGPTPFVAQPWLFQCEETGGEFIERISRRVGVATYWDRDRFVVASIGGGPAEPQKVTLEAGEGLISLRRTARAGLPEHQLVWTDATSRATRVVRFQGAGGRPTSRRLVSAQEPTVPEGAASGFVPCGGFLEAETTHPEIALGTLLEVPGAGEWLVEQITHTVLACGSYSNAVRAVRHGHWALPSRGRDVRALVGPFQAAVGDNNDPLGQGRIRVTLSEDTQRRLTDWIPCLSPAASEARGWQWIPDQDEIVLVVASAECPEMLTCLGALRGTRQRANRGWRRPDNSLKVLAGARGLQIVFDEKQGVLRIETPSASIELGVDGEIKLRGKTLSIDVDGPAKLQAGPSLDIDAMVINLGT